MDRSRFSESDDQQATRRKSLAAARSLEGGMEMGPAAAMLVLFRGKGALTSDQLSARIPSRSIQCRRIIFPKEIGVARTTS